MKKVVKKEIPSGGLKKGKSGGKSKAMCADCKKAGKSSCIHM